MYIQALTAILVAIDRYDKWMEESHFGCTGDACTEYVVQIARNAMRVAMVEGCETTAASGRGACVANG